MALSLASFPSGGFPFRRFSLPAAFPTVGFRFRRLSLPAVFAYGGDRLDGDRFSG
jgi:hypothetical protein